MLGLLLMAGLGFAATAIMDHFDGQTEDDPHAQDDEEPAAHGSLLDDTTSSHDIHAVSDSANDHGEAADHPKAETVKVQPSKKVFGEAGDDTLHGGSGNDLMEGNGGDDRLYGHGGADNLVAFDAGHDTLQGGAGNDSLHGYLVEKQPGDLSYVVEDHQSDDLHGGLGKDTLFLGSDDVGTGGQGADSFHVSWDVEHGHPAEITDYNPKQDKIYVELTSNHADDTLSDATGQAQTITTELMAHGAGTAILINGQAIAHVLGAQHLNAADIGLIHA